MGSSTVEPNQPKKAKKEEVKQEQEKQTATKIPTTKFLSKIGKEIIKSIGKVENFHEVKVIPLFDSQDVGRYRCNVYTSIKEGLVDKTRIIKSYFVYCNHETGDIIRSFPSL